MREIKIPNVSQKRTDNSEKYLIQLIDDGKPTPLDKSVNYRAFITCDGSLVTPAGIELTIQDNQLVLDSAKLDLPAGIYRFEIWAEKDGQRAIYPDSGMKRLVINANATDLPNGTVTSLTLDEFVKEFKNLVKDVGNSSNPNQGGNIEASIDTDKRTITINGKSLTIPEPINLSGLASKDDIAGLVNQTELAEYVKKNELPSIPNMTDYVKKEELPKQPDLSNYATKDDLKTVTSNTTRHAPTGWTLDRTTNPWTIWFDNGCGLQFPNYGTAGSIYGYGFSANERNTNLVPYPLSGVVMSASHGSLTLDVISKKTNSFEYWASDTKVINPIRTDADGYDWSNVYFNDESRAKKGQNYTDRQRVMLRVMYELGIWSIDDIKPFGLTKKEG